MKTICHRSGLYTLVGKRCPDAEKWGPIPEDDRTTGRYTYTVTRIDPDGIWALVLPGDIFANETHATLRDAKAAAAAYDEGLPA